MMKTGKFFAEFMTSSILMFLIYAIKDDINIAAVATTSRREFCSLS